jgi:hypothetical protein
MDRSFASSSMGTPFVHVTDKAETVRRQIRCRMGVLGMERLALRLQLLVPVELVEPSRAGAFDSTVPFGLGLSKPRTLGPFDSTFRSG